MEQFVKCAYVAQEADRGHRGSNEDLPGTVRHFGSGCVFHTYFLLLRFRLVALTGWSRRTQVWIYYE